MVAEILLFAALTVTVAILAVTVTRTVREVMMLKEKHDKEQKLSRDSPD